MARTLIGICPGLCGKMIVSPHADALHAPIWHFQAHGFSSMSTNRTSFISQACALEACFVAQADPARVSAVLSLDLNGCTSGTTRSDTGFLRSHLLPFSNSGLQQFSPNEFEKRGGHMATEIVTSIVPPCPQIISLLARARSSRVTRALPVKTNLPTSPNFLALRVGRTSSGLLVAAQTGAIFVTLLCSARPKTVVRMVLL